MAQQHNGKLTEFVALGVAILGVALGLFTVTGSLANFGAVNDLPEYYSAAKLIAAGKAADAYNLAALFAQEQSDFPMLKRGIALFVPPPAVVSLIPLALVPAAAAPLVWTVMLVAALVASLAIIIRRLKLSRSQACWLVGLVFMSGPAVEAVRLGQLAPLMLLFLCLAWWWWEAKPAMSGAMFSGLCFKPQQLLPAVVFLAGTKSKSNLLTLLILLAVLFVASLGIFGADGIKDYLALLRDPANLSLMQPRINPTVRGQLLNLAVIPDTATTIIAVIALVATLVYTLLLARRTSSDNQLPVLLCVALPLGFLTSLHCHDYDLILLIPGLVLLTKTSAWAESKAWFKAAFFAGVGVFLLPFYNDIHYGYLLEGGTINPYFWLLLLYAGWLLNAAARSIEKFKSQSL